MPIYEYHCNDCGADFEKFLRSMFSQEAIICPECDGAQVAKSLSLIGAGRISSGGGSAPAACGPVG
ncbi:MAG: zinc ribbon domain-containing protein [Caldilineales bacterium]